jgi:hypothetical protein
MTRVYRSGLMFSPPLGLGGHSFTSLDVGPGQVLWRCGCGLSAASDRLTHAISRAGVCMRGVAALPAPIRYGQLELQLVGAA